MHVFSIWRSPLQSPTQRAVWEYSSEGGGRKSQVFVEDTFYWSAFLPVSPICHWWRIFWPCRWMESRFTTFIRVRLFYRGACGAVERLVIGCKGWWFMECCSLNGGACEGYTEHGNGVVQPRYIRAPKRAWVQKYSRFFLTLWAGWVVIENIFWFPKGLGFMAQGNGYEFAPWAWLYDKEFRFIEPVNWTHEGSDPKFLLLSSSPIRDAYFDAFLFCGSANKHMFESITNLRELVGSHSIASRKPLYSLKFYSVPHVWDTVGKPRASRELISLLQVRGLRHDKSWNAMRVLGHRAQFFSSQAEVAAKQGSQGARLAMESQRAGKKKSEAMLMYLVAMVTAMVGITYAAVPLYRKFCQATGYGGTVQRREVLELKTLHPKTSIIVFLSQDALDS